ncbi:hypothetical protein [Aliikangiella maris]|uniref:Transposase DDE domain-containing protein n=1 Tax=Aliikangiella maris TaxID=3162458 RepID=A0ABV3MVC6_9GAMM
MYKQRDYRQRDIVGKRMICSQRYGRSGCGRTRQLYLQQVVPGRHYLLTTLLAFIKSLLSGSTVKHAWQAATAKPHQEPRQAWRWLNALIKQLGLFRTFIKSRPFSEQPWRSFSSRRFNILLPTINQLLQSIPHHTRIQPCLQQRFC